MIDLTRSTRYGAALLLGASLFGSPLALADDTPHAGMSGTEHAHMQRATETYQTHAKVVSIDAAQGLLTLSHEAVPALNWPAMTMPFRITDARWLQGLAVGQALKVDFIPEPGQSPRILSLQLLK